MISLISYLLVIQLYGNTQTPPITIGYVTNTDEIDGCACSLYASTDAKKRDLVVFGYENPAIIRINNRKEVLLSTKAIDSLNPDSISREFRNTNYKLRIDIKILKRTGDEVWSYKGKIVVEDNKSKQKVKKQVMGECGC